MSWWRFWLPKKPKVSVEVEPETYERYKEYAKRRGISLSQWVREALDAASPKVKTGANEAFSVLDAEDSRRELRPVVAPRRIEPLPGPPDKPPAPGAPAGLSPGHPCARNDPAPPGGWSRKECEGTCKLRDRPCNWPAQVAGQCPDYVSRR